ncbi:MAG: murein biosynthesis integral membrane protein MurJ [Acidobacteria bacterium]|nr:murein biosynthesis integral membrane protein MurJ [Acidobacteriota bacterium]
MGSHQPFLPRVLRNLRPSHQHGPAAATMLMTAAQMLSRVVGLVREKYIAFAFGANGQTDAFYAANTLPDYLYYIVAGGAASITFITIYTRYLTEKRENEANHVFSTVLTVMVVVLGALILLGEWFTPQIVGFILPGFRGRPAELLNCVRLTRILMPTQLFFYVGGVLSAVLLTHRMFLVPALTPIVFTLGIIGGGVVLSHQMGIASLAVGAVAGVIAGPFLINAIAASRTGIRYRPAFDLRDEGFREWVRLSIPLMLGVSLASADEWIMRAFASSDVGAISHLNYAKRLFAAPYAVLGLSVGVASMTFFARMFSEGRLSEFAGRINDSIYRAAAASLLLSAWLWAAALPTVDLLFRGGRFHLADARETSRYFAVFGASLALWTAQALYARAFYAARNTLVPMIAATTITAASVPIFWAAFRAWGVMGLAIASDIGIAAQTLALAVLLDRRRLVLLREMKWAGLGKALLVALAALAAGVLAGRLFQAAGSRWHDVAVIAVITLVWAAVCWIGLRLLRSDLLVALSRRAA